MPDSNALTIPNRRTTAPGLTLLLKSTPSLLLPYITVFSGISSLQKFLSLSIPTPIQIALYVSAWPVTFATGVLWKLFRNSRDAAALGAVHAPALKGKLPGNIDILLEWNTMNKPGSESYLGEAFENFAEQLGPFFNVKFLWDDLFFTCEPEHVKTMLATKFSSFEKGEQFRDMFQDLLGTGIVNSDGEMWKFHRAMIRPFFSRDKMIQFEIFDRTATKTIATMKERMNAGYAIDFQDLASRYTFDSTTEFLFDLNINALGEALPYSYLAKPTLSPEHVSDIESADVKASRMFFHAFSDAEEAVAPRLQQGALWPLREFSKNWTSEPMKIVDLFLHQILEKNVRRGSELDGIGEEDLTLLDQLAKETDDRSIWKDEVINLFIAARDTTSALITFVVYKLATRPDILSRLRAEILEHVGPVRAPTIEDLKVMKYLKAVINETLRMYPPNSFNVRQTIEAITLSPTTPGGKRFYIPPRTKVMYSVFFMHRRKDLWGPDALEFDPDRFIDERLHKYLVPNPFIFLPFNAGPRICPGQNFAINETSFLIIRLLQQFEHIEIDHESVSPNCRLPPHKVAKNSPMTNEKVWVRGHLTLFVKGGLWVKMW